MCITCQYTNTIHISLYMQLCLQILFATVAELYILQTVCFIYHYYIYFIKITFNDLTQMIFALLLFCYFAVLLFEEAKQTC